MLAYLTDSGDQASHLHESIVLKISGSDDCEDNGETLRPNWMVGARDGARLAELQER